MAAVLKVRRCLRVSVQSWVGSDVDKNNLGPQSPTSCDSASELLCELPHTYRTLFSEHEVYLGLKSPFNSACSRRSGFSWVRCPGFSVNPGFKLRGVQALNSIKLKVRFCVISLLSFPQSPRMVSLCRGCPVLVRSPGSYWPHW